MNLDIIYILELFAPIVILGILFIMALIKVYSKSDTKHYKVWGIVTGIIPSLYLFLSIQLSGFNFFEPLGPSNSFTHSGEVSKAWIFFMGVYIVHIIFILLSLRKNLQQNTARALKAFGGVLHVINSLLLIAIILGSLAMRSI
ncbi:MAG TPA: hypothetical protein VGE63_01605 [Candidatus Paceibacterota bacterium]